VIYGHEGLNEDEKAEMLADHERDQLALVERLRLTERPAWVHPDSCSETCCTSPRGDACRCKRCIDYPIFGGASRYSPAYIRCRQLRAAGLDFEHAQQLVLEEASEGLLGKLHP
jgi:hypothetical protein